MITKTKPKYLESKLQQSCVAWFRLAYPNVMIISIKNSSKMGGKKTKTGVPIEAIIAKKEGVVSGVADLFVLKGSQSMNGLFIEMKADKGKQSPTQKVFEQYCENHSYAYQLSNSLESFINIVNHYFK